MGLSPRRIKSPVPSASRQNARVWCPSLDLRQLSPRYEGGASLSMLEGRMSLEPSQRVERCSSRIQGRASPAMFARRRKWCRRMESNHLPRHYQWRALPIELRRRKSMPGFYRHPRYGLPSLSGVVSSTTADNRKPCTGSRRMKMVSQGGVEPPPPTFGGSVPTIPRLGVLEMASLVGVEPTRVRFVF